MPAILASKELEMLTAMAIKDPANLALIKPQIDQLVYRLFELAEGEVKFIAE